MNARGERGRGAGSPRWLWPSLLASIGLHLVVVIFWRLEPRAATTLRFRIQPLAIVPLRETEARELVPVAAPRTKVTRGRPEREPVAANTWPEVRDSTTVAEVPRTVDTTISVVAAGPSPIGHDLGDGRLWVRPLTPEQLYLVHRLRLGAAQLADSAIKAMIGTYLDSLEFAAAARPGPPSWTGTIGGAKFGLDSRFVYLAGLRIPSILLALLPIPATGNQSLALDRSAAKFEDLQRAAVRSAQLDDFKAAVGEVRTRMELEHQLRATQRQGLTPEDAPISDTP